MKTFSLLLIAGGLTILILIFGPVAREELQYYIDQLGGFKYSLDTLPDYPQTQIRQIIPVDIDFGIVVPKINVNSSVYPEVDPTKPSEYLPILKKGVAHSKGSSYPDEKGNVFLFAHSTDSFYNVTQYNAVFYLIGKLEKGDEVDIFYNKKRYKYEVVDKIVVEPNDINSYLKNNLKDEKTITLQTCYPPGTTLKRLLITAKIVEPS